MSTLEKIREEINSIEISGQIDINTSFVRTSEQVKNMALKIIDKYAEQEPTMRERVEKEYLFESICEDLKKLQAENDELRKQLEPCDDAISRQMALQQAKASYRCAETFEELANLYEDTLKFLPRVHPKPIECEDAVSRQAVGNMLNAIQMSKDDTWMDYYKRALTKLKELPSVQPKPIECEDAISREDAIKAQCEVCDICGNTQYTKCQYFMQGCNEVKCLRDLPSVRPQEQTGHWIRITNGAMKEKYICSKCGRQIEDDGIEGLLPIKYPYCHCGAKMVEPQESEDKE